MSSLLDDDYVYNQDDFNFDIVDGSAIENNSEMEDIRRNILTNTCVEMPIDTNPPISLRRQLLEDALSIIDGERNKTYGKPENSYGTIADLWSIYLKQPIYPYDVATMMILLKVARIMGSNGVHKDSWVDIAGYAACGFETVQNCPQPNKE